MNVRDKSVTISCRDIRRHKGYTSKKYYRYSIRYLSCRFKGLVLSQNNVCTEFKWKKR